MASNKIGLWIIGARGGVAVSMSLGLAALKRKLTEPIGLVSALPTFSHLPLPDWDQFVVGGHEIRSCSLKAEAERLHRESRVFSESLLAVCGDELDAIDSRIRPGTLWKVGEAIRGLADEFVAEQKESSPQQIVERLQTDLSDFEQANDLQSVVVVNLASTEAPVPKSVWPGSWEEAQREITSTDCQLPASTLYAIAALDLGFPFVNFTPSLGSTPLGIDELSRLRKTCHAGRDGKTGETLLKSVLAPMFAARNLQVMSWVGHNIFGNLDGKILEDPVNKQAKVTSKDHLLSEILGYAPQTLVSIEHIQSLGDWKTAWDHVHFCGFFRNSHDLAIHLAGVRFVACGAACARPREVHCSGPRSK